MAFLFKENGMINRLLLHHVRGRYRLFISRYTGIQVFGAFDP